MTWLVCSTHEAPPGLGSTPILHEGHWYVGQTGPGWFRALKWGLGQPIDAFTIANPQNKPVIGAANDVVAFLATNGCTQAAVPVIKIFQNRYNSSGLPGQLTEDGQYGGNTQRALDNTILQGQEDAGQADITQKAPDNCFGMSVPTIPALDPIAPTPPGPGPGPTPTPPAPSAPADLTPWLIGGAVAAGAAAIGYAYWRKHRRRRAR